MDGEARELETRRLLDEIGRDDVLRTTWDRFHAARGVIAGDSPDALDAVEAAEAIRRLWVAVDAGAESDQTVELVAARRPFGLRTGAAVVGVAAAVVLAVWLFPVGESGGERSTAAPVARVSPPPKLAEDAAWEPLSAEDRARAQAYVLQHLRRQSMANRAHPIPIAKLATYRPQSQLDRGDLQRPAMTERAPP